MIDRIKELLIELGDSFEEDGLATQEGIRNSGLPPQNVYIGEKAHTFYRGDGNPTQVIYVFVDLKKSTAKKVHLGAHLMEDTGMGMAGDELYKRSISGGIIPESIDEAMAAMKPFFHEQVLEERKLPYDVKAVKQAIFRDIPPSCLM